MKYIIPALKLHSVMCFLLGLELGLLVHFILVKHTYLSVAWALVTLQGIYVGIKGYRTLVELFKYEHL